MRLAVVILAAGVGKRMNSAVPKVLHKISGKPMLQHVVDSIAELNPVSIVVVVGRHRAEIRKSICLHDVTHPRIKFITQEEPKGTGDALSKAKTALKDFKGTILVLNGDTPLITSQTLRKFLGLHCKERNEISFISFTASDPADYGRIIRDDSEDILSIIEEKDATEIQKKITEVNSGIYAIESAALSILRKIPLNALKSEYYLTDIVGIARDENKKVDAYCIGTEVETMGINTPAELLKAQQTFRRKLVNKWLERGVRFLDPDSVFIAPDVIIGKETIIYPSVHLEGKTKIGRGCTIYPNVRIIDSHVSNGAVIKDSTLIDSSVIRAKAVIGPFAHIRPGCDIGSMAKIGNFVEIKKTIIGKRTKASHLSYIGDAYLGKDVNIGAGTITCNYDGEEKHRTIIEDNVFIGSDTQLIAPVKIGRGAYVGAGSTITKCVSPMSLALSRAEQKNIEGWAKKRAKVRSRKSEIKKRKGR